MNIRDTSILSYIQLKKDIGEKQALVYDTIKHLNARGIYPTDREIAKCLGYGDPNSVRPRRNELVKMKLVAEKERRICSVSGKLAFTWHITSWKF